MHIENETVVKSIEMSPCQYITSGTGQASADVQKIPTSFIKPTKEYDQN